MNIVFLGIVFVAFVSAAVREILWLGGQISPMESLSKGMIESAAGSVELALGLIGVMTLFLGLMKVAEAGGLLRVVAALIRRGEPARAPDVGQRVDEERAVVERDG